MKHLSTVAAFALMLSGTAAFAEDDTIAYNHGYATAALKIYCGDALKVTDEKSRAKGDRMYKKTKAYREGYEFVATAPRSSYKTIAICSRAGGALVGVNWLESDKEALNKLQRDRQ